MSGSQDHASMAGPPQPFNAYTVPCAAMRLLQTGPHGRWTPCLVQQMTDQCREGGPWGARFVQACQEVRREAEGSHRIRLNRYTI